MTKKLQELIEGFGYLLIRVREDPTLEFEPHVFKHKLMEIAQLAEEEVREQMIGTLQNLLDNHCCNYGCQCGKDHSLYCGYELNHGIELGYVIKLLSNQKEDE